MTSRFAHVRTHHRTIRAAVAAATLATAACFGAAISFAQVPVEAAEISPR